VPNLSVAIRTEKPVIEADSIEALADRLGVPAELLIATVDQYNRACPPEAGFNPRALDGLPTRGICPRRSHWARPIDRPPSRPTPSFHRSSLPSATCVVRSRPDFDRLHREIVQVMGSDEIRERWKTWEQTRPSVRRRHSSPS
jgi:hypothetical protein